MTRFVHLIRNLLIVFGCAAMTLGATGCGSDDGDGTPVDLGNPIPVSGHVLKGSVEGAAVHVRAITAAGTVGAVIAGPFMTDANGRWSGEVPNGTSGAHAVTASGGTYTDESTGNTVNLVSEMRGIIVVGQGNVGNVTPITEAVFINAVFRVQLGATKEAAFNDAIGDMTTALGFDPTTVSPPAIAKSSPAGIANIDIYNVILAGFSALLDANPILSPAFDNAETWDIVKAVATDLSDGKLDGIDIIGNAILVDDGNGTSTLLPFPALDANDISNLIDAANAWAAINAPSITIPPIDLSAFGAPTVTPPGGDFDVTGSLTVTGADAALLGVGTKALLFTPTGVEVESNTGVVGGFTFFRNDMFNSIGVLVDPNGVREVDSVAAQVPGYFWLTPGVSPIPGASWSQLGSTIIVRFTNVELGTNVLQPDNAIILNGELTVTPR